MKNKNKIVISIIFLLILFPMISAINLEVKTETINPTIVLGLNNPIIFNLSITNLGATDNFNFYTFFGSNMSPNELIYIEKDETKNVQLIIYPSKSFQNKGSIGFSYYIKSSDGSELEKKLTANFIELKDVFEITTEDLNPESNYTKIHLKNKLNIPFEKIDIKFSSAFFDFEKTFSIEANQTKTFEIKLNKKDVEKLIAGFYTLNTEIKIENEKANLEGIIKFVEKDIVITTKKDYGFIMNTKIIEKSNKGNSLAKSRTVIKKNIVSRLFTNFNPEPDLVEREGTNIYYIWNSEIKPGETLKILIKTNWLFPFLLIFFIVAIVIFVKKYTARNLTLRKKISFVNAKGGEFALKVSIFVHAKQYVEKIKITDRLPHLTKIYEKFGGREPSNIDEKKKIIEWDFEKLEAGETRMISYVFALPSAIAIYEKDGKITESESNKTFFMAEQRRKKEED